MIYTYGEFVISTHGFSCIEMLFNDVNPANVQISFISVILL